jgi:hypothetical protein
MRYGNLLSILFLFGVSSVLAQTPATVQRGPDSGTRTIVPGVEVLPIPGLPFTGRGHTVFTRTAEGGVSLTSYLEANVGRDSQGRVYRERHHFGPAGVDPQTTIYESSVADPVAHTLTTCVYAMRRCFVTSYYPRTSFALQPVGAFDKGRRFLSRESLGNQTREDLPVVGTRETTTYAPGTVGNEQTITSTREFWYSEDLKTNLAVTRKDPREGNAMIHVTIFSRSEPDPAIFAVPSGFAVQYEHPTNLH